MSSELVHRKNHTLSWYFGWYRPCEMSVVSVVREMLGVGVEGVVSPLIECLHVIPTLLVPSSALHKSECGSVHLQSQHSEGCSQRTEVEFEVNLV